jgi:DNA recombination protein RmuC
MKEFYDFVEQKGFTEEEKRFIPDVVVKLPGNKNIVIDAKVSTDAYLKANKAENETERQKHLEAYLSHIRNHIQTLKSKKYWEAVPDTTEFVIMFIPGENFLQAALDQDPTLIESAARNNVLLGSPTTLITLLKAVAYGWRQEEVARNALKIKDAGQKLYKRIGTFIDHFDGVRKGLDRATDSYNSAVGSLQTRVLPAAKSMNELGLGVEDDFLEISHSEKKPRAIEAPDLTEDDS